MKVLVVHNAYQSQHVGGEDIIVQREIADLKLILGPQRVFEYIVSNDDIQTGKLLFSLWGNRYHYQKLMALIQTHQIDIVHVHNFFPLLTPLAFVAAKKANAKVVHTLHNFRWWCVGGTLYREQKDCHLCLEKKLAWPAVVHGCYRNSRVQTLAATMAFAWYKLKKYQARVDAFFALTHFQQQQLQKLLPADKIFLKSNAILEPEGFSFSPQKKGYLFVGRLEAAKGIEWLLRQWRKLPPDLVLTIIGSGENEKTLRAQYSADNIIFLGKLPQAEVFTHMRKAKYFIHSSLAYETFGLTLVEALAQGTPVIAFNRGARAEFIQSNYNGFLCEPENLSDTILRSHVAENYEQLCRNAYNSAVPFYRANVIEQQVDLYKQILASPEKIV